MIQERIQINAPLQRVYDAFAGLHHWRAALPDVLDVDVLYDDGARQEFLMKVQRPNGSETIRGIRYLDKPNQIELFQPLPPPGFRKMRGTWYFDETAAGTEVRATRIFELENAGSSNAVAERLREFLKTNLNLFKSYIENGIYQS